MARPRVAGGRGGRGWLAVLAVAFACAPDPVPSAGEGRAAVDAAERESVSRLRGELIEAWVRGDETEVMRRVDAAAQVLPPESEALEGTRLIRAWARRRMGASPPPGTLGGGSVDPAGLVLAGDVAFLAWPPLALEAPPQSAPLATRGVEAYRRGADGAWRLFRLVWNHAGGTAEGAVGAGGDG